MNWRNLHMHIIVQDIVTEFSPFYQMFDRNPRLAIDVLIENNTDE